MKHEKKDDEIIFARGIEYGYNKAIKDIEKMIPFWMEAWEDNEQELSQLKFILQQLTQMKEKKE